MGNYYLLKRSTTVRVRPIRNLKSYLHNSKAISLALTAKTLLPTFQHQKKTDACRGLRGRLRVLLRPEPRGGRRLRRHQAVQRHIVVVSGERVQEAEQRRQLRGGGRRLQRRGGRLGVGIA